MSFQIVPIPAGLAVDEPAPTHFELKSLRYVHNLHFRHCHITASLKMNSLNRLDKRSDSSYKYHMTRDQAKTCETYIKQALGALSSNSKMSLQERLEEMGRSVVDEEVKASQIELQARRYRITIDDLHTD